MSFRKGALSFRIRRMPFVSYHFESFAKTSQLMLFDIGVSYGLNCHIPGRFNKMACTLFAPIFFNIQEIARQSLLVIFPCWQGCACYAKYFSSCDREIDTVVTTW